jgi:hypothetical protein
MPLALLLLSLFQAASGQPGTITNIQYGSLWCEWPQQPRELTRVTIFGPGKGRQVGCGCGGGWLPRRAARGETRLQSCRLCAPARSYDPDSQRLEVSIN